MKLHAPLLWPVVCLIAGILLSDYWNAWPSAVMGAAVMAVATWLLRLWPRWQVVAICGSIVFLGAAIGDRCRQQVDVAWPSVAGTYAVVVASEPVLRGHWVVADVLTADGCHRLRCRFRRDAHSEAITIGDGLRLARVYINKVHSWQSGHFDYQRYARSHGISGEAFVTSGHWQPWQVSRKALPLLERVRLRFLCWRHQLLAHYRHWQVDSQVYGILTAMTLGDKSHLDSGLRETYSVVGAAHVLALSGLHLMIIYTVVATLVGWYRWRMLSQLLIILAVWTFAFLVGLSPSVTRAALMVSIYALLAVGYRQRMTLNTLAFAAGIMLIVNPLTIYDVGFQLSFMAVLAIVLFNPLLQGIIPLHVQQRHRWLTSLWSLVTVSLSAQLGTAPLIAYYFGRFATWFLLSNIVVVPLATVVLYLTILVPVLTPWPGLVALASSGLQEVVTLMNRLLTLLARLPASSIEGIAISVIQLACLYVFLGSLWVLMRVLFSRAAPNRLRRNSKSYGWG